MTSDVHSQRTIAASTLPGGTVQEEQTARQILDGRVIVSVGATNADRYPKFIGAETADVNRTGLIVGGAEALITLKRMRRENPGMVLACDPPESSKKFATAENPFPVIGYDSDLFLIPPPTLLERVESQLSAGASFAVTPTGYIQAGDRDALKAVIKAAEKLARDDVVLSLPLDHKWLAGQDRRLIEIAIQRSPHPVAISLGDSYRDPLSHPGVLAAVRELAAMDRAPMFHRIDLAGFDAMAHGSLAVSIGATAGQRRAAIPGAFSRASRTNRGPNVLRTDLLRYRRSLDMQSEWYASIDSPKCPCQVCRGRSLDRFTSADYDCDEANFHNALGIVQMVDAAHDAGGFETYWPEKVLDAVMAHISLSEYVGTKIKPPKELTAWSKSDLAMHVSID